MKTLAVLLVLLCPASPADRAEPGIPVGERLIYRMSWLGVPIGTAELWAKETTMMNGRAVVHVVGIMRTNKVLSTIYPVRNEIHSWIDAHTLTSVKFEKRISEGRTRAHQVVEFGEPTHDVVSAFYWVRRQALVPGQSVRTVVVADGMEWALEVVVLRRRRRQFRGWGRRDTLLVDPRGRVAGLPEKRGKSLIDFSDDASKLPLRITYKAPFGRIVGLLMSDAALAEQGTEPDDADAGD